MAKKWRKVLIIAGVWLFASFQMPPAYPPVLALWIILGGVVIVSEIDEIYRERSNN